MLMCRGVRGATTVSEDSEVAIIGAVKELLNAMIEANDIEEDHVASVFFTSTPDLTSAYPAKAAREVGWTRVALLGVQEIDNPAGMPRAIRILIHWNTTKSLHELEHIYLGEAGKLRPDIVQKNLDVNGRNIS